MGPSGVSQVLRALPALKAKPHMRAEACLIKHSPLPPSMHVTFTLSSGKTFHVNLDRLQQRQSCTP